MAMDARVRGTIDGVQSDSPTIVLNIDFGLLTMKIRSLLLDAYLNHKPLRDCYSGALTGELTLDIISLSWFAVSAFYNRLRTVAQFYCPTVAADRMNQPLPVSRRIKFPTFLSNLLSSIGALRISTGVSNPRYVLIVYAPPNDCEQVTLLSQLIHTPPAPAVPPAVAPAVHPVRVNRLINYLGVCGIGVSTLDYNRLDGALWTTCHLTSAALSRSENGGGVGMSFNVYGTVPPRRYLGEDTIRSLALMDPNPNLNPFEGLTGLTVRFTNNAAILTAAAAASSPGHGGIDGLTYNVNTFGFQPADPGGAGIVVSVQGNNTVYRCLLAERLTRGEVRAALRYRFLAAPGRSR